MLSIDPQNPKDIPSILYPRSQPMHSKEPPRNRLAKVLPEQWRKMLIEHGVPKRKYTAVLRATLVGGRVIEEMIVEQGWIIATDRAGLGGVFEQRIDFDPRIIDSIEIVQFV
jgi:hypothetical protein